MNGKMNEVKGTKRNGKLTRTSRLINFYQREMNRPAEDRKYHMSHMMRVLGCDEVTVKRTITGMNTKGLIHTVRVGRGYYFV